MTAIYAILLFLLMITPHELGHLLVAKAVGVQVNEFAIGMGPAIFKRQKGETLYSLRAFPLGGYCAMEGENEESDNERAFNNRPAWAKILVLVAGAAMNVLTALIIMICISLAVGTATNTVGEVTKGGPAELQGIVAGDKIVAINGQDTDEWQEVINGIRGSKDTVELTVDRNGEIINYSLTPTVGSDKVPVIGIKSKIVKNPIKSISNGAKGTWQMGKLMFSSLKQLISGSASIKDVAGPVGMVSLVGQTGKLGFTYVANLIALISLNLAILNLLPLPALDGGRIIFVIIRKITGKMISDRTEGIVHMIGMALLLGLVLMVTVNDVGRLFQ